MNYLNAAPRQFYCVSWLLLFALLLPQVEVPAAEFGTTVQQISIRQTEGGKGKIGIVGVNGVPEFHPLENAPDIILQKNERATIVIEDANPILFDYSLDEVTTTPTDSYKALEQFAKAVKDTIGVLSPSGTAAARLPTRSPDRVIIDGLDLSEFVDQNKIVLQSVGSIGRWTTASIGGNDAVLSAAQEQVRELALSDIVAGLRSGFDSLGSIQLKIIQGAQLTYSTGGQQKRTADSIDDIRANVGPNARKDIDIVFSVIALRRSDILESATTIESFSADFLEIGTPITLGTVDYSNNKKQTAPIIIKGKNTFSEYFSKETIAYQSGRAGTYNTVFVPYQRLHLSIAPGILYSFVRDPEFSVKELDTGELTIDKSENSYAEFSGAVVLNITHDRFVGEGVEPHIQIGVSPSSDNLAFLLGIGLRAYSNLNISGGVIYQRVNRLKDGLSVGDVLQNANDLATDDEFDSGLYLMLSSEF